ncbi:XRE family transcriptional regulator, partial [bacterium]|nr:XRE family transcriptional regulator [bacterium]
MRWIDATDLKNWASTRDSQEYLPLVIRRLIRATVNRINFLSFPAGESIVYPGWDGILKSEEETEYIPKGLSGWEVGTDQSIRKKAEEDYQKRKQNPCDLNPSETIFIFVTPRVWTKKKKDEWVTEKKEEKFWRDVRVYDARDLEEWLEQAPAVGAWLAKHIGKYPQQNVYSLEEWWNEWSKVTHPPLPPELVLAGRDKQIEEVKKWLNSDPSLLVVQASTKDESLAFLSAVILTLPEEERERFLSKSIVISDKEAFRHVATTCKSSLLL